MKILFASYYYNEAYNDPYQWLERIKAFLGIPEALSKYHTVICIEQMNYAGALNKNGVQYYFLNTKKADTLFPIQLHRFIKKMKPDIVLVQGTHNPLQVIQLKLMLKTAKIIVQNHERKAFRNPKSYLQKIADTCIEAYLFASREIAADWINKKIITNQKKIWEIMGGSSFFSPVEKKQAVYKTGVYGSPVFLFIGRLNDNKDPLLIIRSFLRYNKLQPSSRLYMIYQTTELLDKIKDILNKSANGGSITLAGMQNHDAMLYWYSSADFIISASHFEVAGAVIFEAMSCGCIPVLNAIPSFKKMTANGSACGILYDVEEEDGLFNALITTQHLNIEEEKKKALKQFREDLSFDAIAKQISEKIKTL